tara:strand:+ start:2940 stop:3620 length:681 start_codon:yes stop_codon:yes gene_type:complete
MNADYIIDDLTARDFSATYSETYLKFKSRDDDGFYPAKVIDVCSSNNGFAVVAEKLNGDRIVLDLSDPSTEIDFSWPTLGYINVKDHSVFVQRRAARQWKKGLRELLLRFDVMDDRIIHELRDSGANYGSVFGPYAYGQLYNPEYTGIEDAIELVISGEKIARCISSKFAISSRYQMEKPVLMYKDRIVGVVDEVGRINIPKGLDHLIPMLERVVPNGYNSISLQS